jgi:hypothetical protein
MAKLYVTEFADVVRPPNSASPPFGALNSLVIDQAPITFSASTQSAAFATGTKFVRVHTDSICSIAYGSNPTATTSSFRMAAGQTEYFGVNPGDKLAVITNT